MAKSLDMLLELVCFLVLVGWMFDGLNWFALLRLRVCQEWFETADWLLLHA